MVPSKQFDDDEVEIIKHYQKWTEKNNNKFDIKDGQLWQYQNVLNGENFLTMKGMGSRFNMENIILYHNYIYIYIMKKKLQ